MQVFGILFGLGIVICLARNLHKVNRYYKAYTCPDRTDRFGR
jgi:uncharacterized membrane protein YeiB